MVFHGLELPIKSGMVIEMCKVTTTLKGYLSKEMQLAEISWGAEPRLASPSWIKVNYRTGVYYVYLGGKLVYIGMTWAQVFQVRLRTFLADLRGIITNHRGKMRFRARWLRNGSTKPSDYTYRVYSCPKNMQGNKRYLQMVETLSILLYCKKYGKLPAFNDKIDRYGLSKSEISALPKPLRDYYNNEYQII